MVSASEFDRVGFCLLLLLELLPHQQRLLIAPAETRCLTVAHSFSSTLISGGVGDDGAAFSCSFFSLSL